MDNGGGRRSYSDTICDFGGASELANYSEYSGALNEHQVDQQLNIPIQVFGPETHMTAIVGMALSKRSIPEPSKPLMTTANFLLPNPSVCFNLCFDFFKKNRNVRKI